VYSFSYQHGLGGSFQKGTAALFCTTYTVGLKHALRICAIDAWKMVLCGEGLFFVPSIT
jgi:hypothetical protein